MKKLLFLVLLCKVSTILLAQKPSLKQIYKAFETKDTRIIYSIKDGAEQRDFLFVTIKEADGRLIYSYEVADEAHTSGEVEMNKEALTYALAINHSFEGGKQNLTNATSLFLSEEAYKQAEYNRLSLKINDKSEYAIENESIYLDEAGASSSTTVLYNDEKIEIDVVYLSAQGADYEISVLNGHGYNRLYPLFSIIDGRYNIHLSKVYAH